ncbi:hypothetical protein FA95DRAFT_1555532 [Auriscalpium vulgare]|uniref:Uncharacterized protein n=1 Tax=Auriscalpium vulgare TaxID=40419 RepID=A0ACB8S3F4_9AGAM|nr:hypothetical protein FA95DRAFT_1555532 [Auriscalpium vulgare]
MAADPPVGMHAFQNPAKPHKTRFRCADCGGQVVSRNLDTQAVSVWGAQLQRGADGRIERWAEVRPTAHIFYDTRMLDVDDGLGKWDGYEGRSQRIA